jgi:hypothetical protein
MFGTALSIVTLAFYRDPRIQADSLADAFARRDGRQPSGIEIPRAAPVA